MSVRYELHGIERPGHPRLVWRFGEPDCPLRLAEAPTGLGGAQATHVRQANARQAGATWRGIERGINTIGLVVRVGPVEPGAVAIDLWQSWRGSLGTGEQIGEFHAISPGGGDRFQWVRRESVVADSAVDLLDTVGAVTESVVLGSDESWWMGQTAHLGPLAPGSFSGRSLYNDGDCAAWVFWQLTGPGSYEIGVGDEAVMLPMLGVGEVWTVETNPEYPHIKNSDGLDTWEIAGNIGWYTSVPAKSLAPLHIVGTGTSSVSRVEAWMPQKYEAAVA
ncbi:hypothetical protein [Nocardia bovistercoris]|uniref:Minor tail protein n=1 Tax=Nocardia bovistercoris TaxID=2785916 RepID=A0A931ICW7_9NOCA|nr:hypothetical protein [Nocardia bovistercoris]MBH0778826.1 hypothetical protein [Nocardia bovistercoris]